MLELITGIVVAAVAVGLVVEPLLRSVPPAPAPADEMDVAALDETDSPKLRALLALREIEFDRATGKLSDADYAELKTRYSHEALRAMDTEASDPGASGAPLDAAEALVARVKAQHAEACSGCHGALEPAAQYCSRCGRAVGQAEADPRCWICGDGVTPGAKFCGSCGAAVPADLTAA